MSRRRDIGALWHFLAGALVGGLASFGGVLGVGIACAVLALGPGIGRELWQHRDDRPRMTPHRWLEALAWPVGGALGLLFA